MPRERNAIQKDTCTKVFKAAPFTTARTWKRPYCPHVHQQRNKDTVIHAMNYYSAIERNEVGSLVEMWIDLENIIQSEVSQKEKNKYCSLMHICGI